MKRLLLLITICISSVSFGQVPNYVPTNGLVGWWGFNGNANDESGNGNNGTVNGANLTDDHLGNLNSAYVFNGNSDFIALPYSSLWEFGLNDFTVAGWFLSLDGTNDNIIRFDNGLSPSSLWGMRVKNANMNFICTGGGNAYSPLASNTVSTGVWHHSVMIRTPNALLMYLDGNLIHTEITPTIANIQSNGTYYPSIGRLGSYNAEYFEGNIDDIGIWNRALTECEIQDLYNSSLNSTTSVTQTDVTLTADQDNATYQWIDCDNNNSPISGETNQSYTPTVTGNYAVEVTVNGCTSVSECVLVDFTGVDELLNPTTKKLIKIVNLLGQEVEYTPNTVLIYQYSDGTSEKVFTIED